MRLCYGRKNEHRCLAVLKPGVTHSDYFFFQAEDGIRDYKVTGVQTCALPISDRAGNHDAKTAAVQRQAVARRTTAQQRRATDFMQRSSNRCPDCPGPQHRDAWMGWLIHRNELLDFGARSEEHTSELQSPCNLVCRLLLEK